MAKKSKLLAALDAQKGRDHNLERQKKLQKQAVKRKRVNSEPQDTEEEDEEEDRKDEEGDKKDEEEEDEEEESEDASPTTVSGQPFPKRRGREKYTRRSLRKGRL